MLQAMPIDMILLIAVRKVCEKDSCFVGVVMLACVEDRLRAGWQVRDIKANVKDAAASLLLHLHLPDVRLFQERGPLQHRHVASVRAWHPSRRLRPKRRHHLIFWARNAAGSPPVITTTKRL